MARGLTLLLIFLALGQILEVRGQDSDVVTCSANTTPEDFQGQGQTGSRSASGRYQHAAVVSDNKMCSQIGRKIMEKEQGNAVDAAVAVVLCEGVTNCHSAGIGGGALIVVYNSTERKAEFFNARERAPAKATEEMFVDNPDDSQYGGMAVGVPGELKGLWEIHSRYGKVAWKKLVKPTIDLCLDGIPISKALYHAAKAKQPVVGSDPEFSFIYDNNGDPYPEGYLMTRPKLAKTLKLIAKYGAKVVYDGILTDDVVADIQDRGGIISRQDLADFYVDIGDPVTLNLTADNLVLYSSGSPGSGAVLAYVMNILSGYDFGPSSISTDEGKVLTYHRIVEAFKFAYARRSELGDSEFVDIAQLVADMTSPEVGDDVRAQIDDDTTHAWEYYGANFDTIVPEDLGTASFAIMDGNGDVVAITSTINLDFGSKVKGTRTGIIFNNQMDDFSTPNTINAFGVPASSANFIRPGKRPLSSMSPTVVVDSSTGEPQLVVGASGGTRIITSVALTSIRTLWFNETVTKAVDEPRMHHQLRPEELWLERGTSEAMWDGLQAKGHNTLLCYPTSVVTAIRRTPDNQLEAVSDWRKGGAPDGY